MCVINIQDPYPDHRDLSSLNKHRRLHVRGFLTGERYNPRNWRCRSVFERTAVSRIKPAVSDVWILRVFCYFKPLCSSALTGNPHETGTKPSEDVSTLDPSRDRPWKRQIQSVSHNSASLLARRSRRKLQAKHERSSIVCVEADGASCPFAAVLFFVSNFRPFNRAAEACVRHCADGPAVTDGETEKVIFVRS